MYWMTCWLDYCQMSVNQNYMYSFPRWLMQNLMQTSWSYFTYVDSFMKYLSHTHTLYHSLLTSAFLFYCSVTQKHSFVCFLHIYCFCMAYHLNTPSSQNHIFLKFPFIFHFAHRTPKPFSGKPWQLRTLCLTFCCYGPIFLL